MQQLEKIFFALIGCETNKTPLSQENKNLITPEILPALFKLAKRHDLAHVIGNALEKNGFLEENSKAKKHFLYERNVAVYRYEQQSYELEQICKTLEDAKIPFIPLKGSVIRSYYKEPWQRTSCDIDVLVEEKNINFAKEVLQKQLNYTAEKEVSANDISLFSASGVHLELHFSLAEDFGNQKVNEQLLNAFNYVKEDKSYKKTFTNEFFYFYHVAHMAKHFEIGGCGVRPFLDVYILKQSEEYKSVNYDIIEKVGLKAFASAVEESAKVWFGNDNETHISNDIKEYVLYAGMYADIENKAVVQQIKNGGKFKYILSRIFLPYEELKTQYPNLENKKWLTLFYQVKRWFRLLFGKDHKNVSRELKANANVNQEKKQKIAKLFKDLEL